MTVAPKPSLLVDWVRLDEKVWWWYWPRALQEFNRMWLKSLLWNNKRCSINPQVSCKTVHFVKLAKGNLKSNLWTCCSDLIYSRLLWSYRWCCQPDYGAQVDTGSWSRDWELKKSPGMTVVEGPVGDGPPWRLVWSQQLFAQSATYAQHNVI